MDEQGRSNRSPRGAGRGGAGSAGSVADQLRDVLREMRVVTKDDMAGISARLDTIEERQSASEARYVGLAEALAKVQTELQQMRAERNTGVGESAGTGASRWPTASGDSKAGSWAGSNAGDREEWRPRGIVVRGWAPFGTPASRRIDDTAAKKLVTELIAMLPLAYQGRCRPTVPFATNHQVYIGIDKGGFSECQAVAEILQQKIDQKKYQVKGCDLRAAVETSPTRKNTCKLFYSAVDFLKEKLVPEENVKICPKGLRIYDSRSLELVGYPKDGRWYWTNKLDHVAGRPLQAETVLDAEM